MKLLRSIVMTFVMTLALVGVTVGPALAAVGHENPSAVGQARVAEGAEASSMSAPSAAENDVSQYAARERDAQDLKQFKGGEGVSIYIGGSALAVVVVVVLLIVLL